MLPIMPSPKFQYLLTLVANSSISSFLFKSVGIFICGNWIYPSKNVNILWVIANFSLKAICSTFGIVHSGLICVESIVIFILSAYLKNSLGNPSAFDSFISFSNVGLYLSSSNAIISFLFILVSLANTSIVLPLYILASLNFLPINAFLLIFKSLFHCL